MRNGWMAAASLAVLVASGGVANAAGLFQDCRTQQGQVDPQQTQNWVRLMQANDMQGAQQVAGVWYTEIPAPELNMITYQHQMFYPNGIWEYQNRVCTGGTNACGDYAGHGQFAAVRQNDGTLYVMVNFSDTQRTNTCTGSFARFPDPQTMETSAGARFKRVR